MPRDESFLCRPLRCCCSSRMARSSGLVRLGSLPHDLPCDCINSSLFGFARWPPAALNVFFAYGSGHHRGEKRTTPIKGWAHRQSGELPEKRLCQSGANAMTNIRNNPFALWNRNSRSSTEIFLECPLLWSEVTPDLLRTNLFPSIDVTDQMLGLARDFIWGTRG